MSAGTRWVTFDCYGTLVDWQTGFAAALRPLVGDSADDVLRAYHVHERRVEREQPYWPYKRVLITALVRAAADCGLSLSASAAQALPEAWPSMPLFDDVEPMLAELRLNGLRLAVLTNCDEEMFEATHRTFKVPFDFVLTSERVRGYKPAPWHFRGFQRLTRVGHGDWVHVACSIYHDIAPAQALGIEHVWLDRERAEPGASAPVRVHSAAEVAGAVSRRLEREAGRALMGALACC